MIDRTTSPHLSAVEILEINTAVERAVLQPEDLGVGVEENGSSYLRLVAAASEAHAQAGRLLHQAVTRAKKVGHSWTTIGEILDISRQAAQQRFGSTGREQVPNSEHQHVINGATGFNEMDLLEVEGAAGNHLVSFGPLYLVVESSDIRWEHRRVTALRLNHTRRHLEAEGWTYVGTWFPFHYFKRPVSDLPGDRGR